MNILITNLENPISKKIYDLYQTNNININFTNKIENVSLIKSIFKKHNIDLIIHNDAIYDLKKCTTDKSSINKNISDATIISKACKSFDIPIIYISSYEVYGDTQEIPYIETDLSLPINNLGVSQKKVENIFSSNNIKCFILRSSWVFGTDSCYIKQIIANAKTPMIFCNSKIVNPTSIHYLFKVIIEISKTSKYGTYNCSGLDYCSKLEFTEYIFNIIDLPKKLEVFPKMVKQKLAPSAEFSGLNCNLLESTFKIKNLDWKTSVIQYLTSEFL